MEEYIGACLIIRTKTDTHVGRLQHIEPENNKMVVEISGTLAEINLDDINDVELLAEEDSILMSKTKKEEKKVPSTYITYDLYKKIVEISDSMYGPSRREIAYSGARGVLHLLVNIFRLMDKRFVIYTGSGLFSEIGVILARLCLLYGSDVVLVPSEKTQSIARELFYYERNNGVISNKRTEQPVVIIADTEAREEMVSGAERVIFLGDYQNISGQNMEAIFFGVPVQDPYEFAGNSILCDVGLSPKVFSKYNIRKYAPKLLQKIAKQ
ncbi:uncharacterized protein NEMAJ01_1759 [Nematocida major]|uniref:uncharacterized protein n=1 Tax=Nematocida major TaxID=1912982 RepID=UPI0020080DE5|nr:uncharacterized protein NEMAJ01_1759 [Nematocida major]KAH9386863.1 hypothetical protein NEMAJ01_1759 [Nematocida major]